MIKGLAETTALLILSAQAWAGMWVDLGRPVIGSWVVGGWTTYDPVSGKELLWGSEESQEGGMLFAVDLQTGKLDGIYERKSREVNGHAFDEKTGRLYVLATSGLLQPGNFLAVWDPKKRKLESLGFPNIPRNRFAGGLLLARDRKLYAGTHPDGHLASYDLESGEWKDLGQLAPPPIVPGQHIWLSGLVEAPNGEIVGVIRRAPPHQTVAYDPKTGKVRQLPELAGRSMIVEGGFICVNEPPGVALLDAEFRQVAKLTMRNLKVLPQASYAPDVNLSVELGDKRGGLYGWIGNDIVRLNLKDRTLARVATVQYRGDLELTPSGKLVVSDISERRFAVIDPETGRINYRSFTYQGTRATSICGLAKSSDGRIYGSNIIGMNIFCYDPGRNELKDLGKVGWPGAEVYNLIEHKGKIYFGTYGGAIWGVYDPAKPWKPNKESQGRAPDSNPRNLGPLGADMNRPFEYAIGPDDKIYIACRANYGLPGGGLAVFDPKTEKAEVYRDAAQSVQCVAADDRYVYGGTSVRGGRGSIETTKEGRLFIFDPKLRRRIYETVPVSGAIAVVSLAVDRDRGQLYGTTDNAVLFCFDINQREVTRTWQLRSRGTPLQGVPEEYGIIHIRAASDGDIYGVTRKDLFKLDVQTGTLIYLDPPPIDELYQIVEGEPGVFYVGARTHLLKYYLRAPIWYR